MNNENREMQKVIDYFSGLDYKYEPVDVCKFLKDQRYMGKATHELKEICPAWIGPIAKIFSDDLKYIVVLSGNTDTVLTAVTYRYCIPYILYKLGSLKNPLQLFGKDATGKMSVCFFNLANKLNKSIGFRYMQLALIESRWFADTGGYLINTDEEKYMELPIFNWIHIAPYTHGFSVLGGSIICGVLDELGNSQQQVSQRPRIMYDYEMAIRRFEEKFVKNGESLGRMFIIAPKPEDLSFFKTYINQTKRSNKTIVFEKEDWKMPPKKGIVPLDEQQYIDRLKARISEESILKILPKDPPALKIRRKDINSEAITDEGAPESNAEKMRKALRVLNAKKGRSGGGIFEKLS